MKVYIFFIILSAVAAKKNFTGYSVYKLFPITAKQIATVLSLENDYDVWSEYGTMHEWAQVMVRPEQQKSFLKLAKDDNIHIEKIIPDVQSLIDKYDKVASYEKGTRNENFSWDTYHTLEDIYSWLEYLEERFPNNVEVVLGGQSFEDREIRGVKLSFGRSNRSAVIEGGIHAREWISPATVTYIINDLLTSTNADIRDLAESFDWHIFPVTNPDGYVYTHTQDRMWRKNRSTQYTCGGNTAGVDLNRNFDYNWMLIGASSDACSETHAGSQPFSEPETRSFARYVSAVPNLDVFLTFHSFSQLILIPYGHTVDFLDNYADVYEVGVRAADALYRRYNTTYRVGTSSNLLAPVSGNSRDWAKATLRVPICWLYELRDTGEYAFILPEEQIIPQGLEVMDSLVSILNTGRNLNYYQRLVNGVAVNGISFISIALVTFVTFWSFA